jgi:hypothetical protein
MRVSFLRKAIWRAVRKPETAILGIFEMFIGPFFSSPLGQFTPLQSQRITEG